jgi:hypothetical protein
LIEKIAKLHKASALTDEEFITKKTNCFVVFDQQSAKGSLAFADPNTDIKL